MPKTSIPSQPQNPVQTTLAKNLSNAGKIAVVGIGSELRGDDIAGVLLAWELQKRIDALGLSDRLLAINGGSAPENVTGQIAQWKPAQVVVVDAADFKLPPGSIEFIDPKQMAGVSFSTHTLPLSIILGYLEQTVGCHFTVIGIQPESTEFGIAPSESVKASVQFLADSIVAISKVSA